MTKYGLLQRLGVTSTLLVSSLASSCGKPSTNSASDSSDLYGTYNVTEKWDTHAVSINDEVGLARLREKNKKTIDWNLARNCRYLIDVNDNSIIFYVDFDNGKKKDRINGYRTRHAQYMSDDFTILSSLTENIVYNGRQTLEKITIEKRPDKLYNITIVPSDDKQFTTSFFVAEKIK